MSKKIHKLTLATGARVPAGATMLLTARQADSRRHVLTAEKDWHKGASDDRRLPFTAANEVFFKGGEDVWVIGDLDRALAAAAGAAPVPDVAQPAPGRDENGDTPEMAQLRKQFDAAYARARTDARRELLDEIEQRNALIDAADAAADVTEKARAAHEAETDAEKRKPLEKALEDALTVQAKADKAVNDLPELKA